MVDKELIKRLKKDIEHIENNKLNAYSLKQNTNNENSKFVLSEDKAQNPNQDPFDKVSLDELQINSHLSISSNTQVHTLESCESSAYTKLLALINASDKSSATIRKRLVSDGFSEKESLEAIDRAINLGLIDDMRFADILIRSRIRQGKGFKGIERELVRNEIDLNSIPDWPFAYGYSHETEQERALVYIQNKPSRSKNKREGAFKKLMQAGFSNDIAGYAARIWSEETKNKL